MATADKFDIQYFGRVWTVNNFRVGNGSKAFGVNLWFNTARVGLEIHYWTWEFTVMRERKIKESA